MQLAKQLRERLARTGLSQAEIGRGAGIAQSTVGRFVNGETDLTLANYTRLLAWVARHESKSHKATKAAA